jgi:lactate racemase
MIDINIPFHKGFKSITLDKKRVKAVLYSKAHEYTPDKKQEDIVRIALENPVDSERLKDLANDKKNILLITSDHTRPVPSKITLPLILHEIRQGNPDAHIKILIATGCHRQTTLDEMNDKFGVDIVENEELINHDCTNTAELVLKGILPSGGELWLNSLVDWAELVVSEGFIEPHFFAGFSGGRKSILPGIAGQKTVYANHCSKFIADNQSRTGNLSCNPIHTDMIYAAKVANLLFILNVVIDSEKKIIAGVAGHPEKAHQIGCEFVSQLSEVESVKADIVITSNGGAPLDQNIYQAVKGMTAAESCLNEGGVIIMVSACNDGHGGEDFYHWFADAENSDEVTKKIVKIPQDKTIADQWQAQILARILSKYKVIIVTDMCSADIIKNMHMMHASTINDALKLADEIIGSQSQIVIIPDGVGVIVK